MGFVVDGRKDLEGYVTDIAVAAVVAGRSMVLPSTVVLKIETAAFLDTAAGNYSQWRVVVVQSRRLSPAGYCVEEASRRSGHFVHFEHVAAVAVAVDAAAVADVRHTRGSPWSL